ncbi:MAG: hypothetical protein FWD05_04055 [Oscillospiraceae bacterium]|nr:hypothetical protein [Oscillospiraceae bacterium]
MNMNSLVLTEIKTSGNIVEYSYSVAGEWSRFFSGSDTFFIEYDFPLDDVPEGVLAIPFLCNILPISWVSNAEINVPAIDHDFLKSIPEFKQGYIDMYPMINFEGTMLVGQVERNEGIRSGCASLFSGGADSIHTMISHLDEGPALICIWGADVCLDDEGGWKRVKTHLIETAGDYDFDYTTIKSSFRKVIDEDELSKYISRSGDCWWHGFQHGIALIGHTAPYMYANKLRTLYIASSFRIQDNVSIASHYSIDNFVRFANSNVIHDGATHHRQEKIGEICNYSDETGKKVSMRVCWQSIGGGNCSNCEKCFRTMLAITAEGHNPADYGFIWNKQVIRKVKYSILWRYSVFLRYGPIIERMRETIVTKKQKKQWRWLITRTPEQLDNTFGKKIFNCVRKTRIWRFIRTNMCNQ